MVSPPWLPGDSRRRQLNSGSDAHFRNSHFEHLSSRIEQIPTLLRIYSICLSAMDVCVLCFLSDSEIYGSVSLCLPLMRVLLCLTKMGEFYISFMGVYHLYLIDGSMVKTHMCSSCGTGQKVVAQWVGCLTTHH